MMTSSAIQNDVSERTSEISSSEENDGSEERGDIDQKYKFSWGPIVSVNYSLPMMILVAVLLFVVIVATAFGNFLVGLSLFRYRYLRTISNYLIGNLALSDFLLATTILPLSIFNECLGHWIFGEFVCNAWLTMDVLYCTASLWNLCVIAFDRYTATLYPLWYRENKSAKQAGIYVALVWLIAAAICVPPVLGWNKALLSSNFSAEMSSFSQSSSDISVNYVYNNVTDVYSCNLFEIPGYVLYSACGSFYIPFAITSFFYIRIFVALRQRMRVSHKKAAAAASASLQQQLLRDRAAAANKSAALSTTAASTTSRTDRDARGTGKSATMKQDLELVGVKGCEKQTKRCLSSDSDVDLDEDDNVTASTRLTTVASVVATRSLTDDKERFRDANEALPADAKVTLSAEFAEITHTINNSKSGNDCRSSRDADATVDTRTNPDCGALIRKEKTTNGESSFIERKMAAVASAAKSFNKSSAKKQPSSSGCERSESRDDFSSSTAAGAAGGVVASRPSSVSVAAQQRRFEQRELRATVRMGIIIVFFCGMWIGFFTVYVLRSWCPESCPVPRELNAFFFWLGYANSSVNPILYTIFNDEFRRAFLKILGYGKKQQLGSSYSGR